MDTLAFLQRVLPTEGFVASLVLDQGSAPSQRMYSKHEELARAVTRLSALGHNVYYAVASFQNVKGGRRQNNVHRLKSLFLDIDCGPGKAFPSWKEGLRALGSFVATNKLPKPMILHSGNGLHAYWVLQTEITLADWKPLAAALKQLIPTDMDGYSLFDPAVPMDSARVLRPLHTVNPKGGRTVSLLVDAPPVAYNDMVACLNVKPAPVASPLRDALGTDREYPPANSHVIENKCAQIQWAAEKQADVPEPFWYAMLGVAAFCKEPEQTAIRWSHAHPEYDEAKTLRKLEQWRQRATGPATCAHLRSERPEGCKKCPLFEKIASPAQLGIEHDATDVAENVPDEVAHEIPLPKPFKRTLQGIKVRLADTDVDVCSFDLYPLGYGYDESLGVETVRYRWNRMHTGWQPLTLRQAHLTPHLTKEFAVGLADQGIVAGGKKQTELLQMFMREYMNELRKLRAMTNVYSTMGWKDNGTQFLLGNTLYRNTKGAITAEETVLTAGQHRLATSMYETAGTLEEWAAFTEVLDKADMPIQAFALCLSFSAPLYAFSGIKGLTVNLYGPTGSGKTLAQLWQQSVWGNPVTLHYSAKFTQHALFHRMGLYNHLPVTIDETTMLPVKEAGDFLYWVSQGRDKARLSRAAEEKDARTWATVVTTSANRSIASMLTASGLETDAQMARLLEIMVTPHQLFTQSMEAGRKIHAFLTSHYGMAGRAFIAHLLEKGNALRDELAQHRDTFYQTYNCKFGGDERFWEQCFILADYAGAKASELGLLRCNHQKAIAHVLLQLGVMRQTAKEFTADAFDVLAEYINEFADAAVTVMYTDGGRGQPDFNRLPRGEVRIRFDLHRKSVSAPFDRGTVMIDRKHFRWWVSSKGWDFRTLVREYIGTGADATPQSQKALLGRDTPIKLSQQYVLGISLQHPRLSGILSDADDAALNTTLSKLAVVQGGKQ